MKKTDRKSENKQADQRRKMIEQQVIARGVNNPRVLDAMLHVPRELYVPAAMTKHAYDDKALPIEQDQTISQPFIVAYMTDRLEVTTTCRVLEIGTGSGYQTAILAQLCAHVYSIERIASLGALAGGRLQSQGFGNVTLNVGDGSLGWPEYAPYDRILVTAAAPKVPQSLVEQLEDGGILIAPVGAGNTQNLVRVTKSGDQTHETPLLACRFVKLFGEQGWVD